MIKIFGKIRYHWQPDLSWAITYWSATFTPLFLAMVLLLEKLKVSTLFFSLISFFLIFSILGLNRYFELKEDYLRISTANPWAIKKIPMREVSKIEVSHLAIRIFSKDFPQGIVYRMRKWPKKYFVNHLALHPAFAGEVILIDHMIEQDYFEEYYAKKPHH